MEQFCFIFEFPETVLYFDTLKIVFYRVNVSRLPHVLVSMGSSVGEELTCQRERGNLVNPFNQAGKFLNRFYFRLIVACSNYTKIKPGVCVCVVAAQCLQNLSQCETFEELTMICRT